MEFGDYEFFELTSDHVKLIQRMYVGWQYCEFGAPEIDPKRPYGNSSVVQDIAEILGWDYPDEDAMLPGEFDERQDEIFERASKVHAETQTALQILCERAYDGLSLGPYKRRKYGGKWEPTG